MVVRDAGSCLWIWMGEMHDGRRDVLKKRRIIDFHSCSLNIVHAAGKERVDYCSSKRTDAWATLTGRVILSLSSTDSFVHTTVCTVLVMFVSAYKYSDRALSHTLLLPVQMCREEAEKDKNARLTAVKVGFFDTLLCSPSSVLCQTWRSMSAPVDILCPYSTIVGIV